MSVSPAIAAQTTSVTWRIDDHTGADVLADPTPWVKAYEEVYAHALHLPDHNDPTFAERLAFSAGREGFRLTSCHADGVLAGFAYGYTLPASTGWWNGFTPLPGVDADEMTAERPGRTFAMCEALVPTAFRRSGIVERAFPFLIRGRTEERVAGLVAETNAHALDLTLRNGWTHVGDVEPHPGWRRHHALIMPLR
ncbi:GNAT family N-acetyltransferase [Nocardiopsis sp. N85]|uniref:GNAT family N-acetyltransferase n=1 Tax=Nocardiopsis sp. N85 TaxID=3029400 RepID=UPI00237FB54E|nr:GNAT family N-acetyltransferase [Nocardiopsis sp. N85]MDE3725271.1 GNAT family N-acetyltransferase [Nocardiopsis sp. N85]